MELQAAITLLPVLLVGSISIATLGTYDRHFDFAHKFGANILFFEHGCALDGHQLAALP